MEPLQCPNLWTGVKYVPCDPYVDTPDLLDLGLPHRGNHPAYAAHLKEDLWGGLSTSGVLYEPLARSEFAHPLTDIASVTEIAPKVRPASWASPDVGAAAGLSGRVTFKRWCDCCPDVERWDFAGGGSHPIRGDVLSKFSPSAYVAEAYGFSNLSLGQDIVNNVVGGPVITGATLSAGGDPETQVVVVATIA